MREPTDVANLALDAIGSEFVLGDLEDGTMQAQTCLRAYRECRTRLLRGAHWQFARKQEPLLLLGDATGNTPNFSTQVIRPWLYEYAYPNDAVAVRFIPHHTGPTDVPPGNYAIPQTPLYGNMQNNVGLRTQRLHPARFLVTRDVNYPPAPGQSFWEVQGLSPSGRTVICTNVKHAYCVYTSDVKYPTEWDANFAQAMVAYLAQEIVMKLQKDKKLAIEMRRDQIALVKNVLTNARVADGNETWSSTDHMPDFIKVRFGGGGPLNGERFGMGGYNWCGWESLAFADGSAF